MKKTLLGLIALALVAVSGNAAIAAPVVKHKAEHRLVHRRVVHRRIVRHRIVHRRVAKKVGHKKMVAHHKK